MLEAVIEQCFKHTLSGQITFEEYMEIVLYHPQYGYYASQIADIGRGGDFFTASSLGRDFWGAVRDTVLLRCGKFWGSLHPFT